MQGVWWTRRHCTRFFFEIFDFPLSISFRHCAVFVFIVTLALSGQVGETLELSNTAVRFEISGSAGERSTVRLLWVS
jgi:hypothetical protein